MSVQSPKTPFEMSAIQFRFDNLVSVVKRLLVEKKRLKITEEPLLSGLIEKIIYIFRITDFTTFFLRNTRSKIYEYMYITSIFRI